MMISDLSVKRPVVAAVVSILLVIVGIVAFGRLSVREYPDVDPPIVSIETRYRGAAANVVETRITQPIEDRISGIEGVEAITSRSTDGRSDISIEFSASRDVDAAANDVRDRVSGALGNLPDEADPPEIRKVDADDQPIMWIVVSAEGWTSLQIADYADRFLVDRFASIDGVARVQFGGLREAMRVWIDRERLAAFGLTVGDIVRALQTQNVELPAGRVESQDQNLTVRVNRAYRTPQDFAGLVVSRGEGGYLVRLGDIARIEEGAENPYTSFRFNGSNAIGMGVVRQSGANTLDVARAAKAEIEAVSKTLPKNMKMVVGGDSSQFIEAAVNNVWKTLAEAAILVVLVIYAFLGSVRATFIPAITVPICLVSTFIVLWALGYSINLLTLLALVLAIGLVVDDAIVVLENVYRRIEEGESPLVAAYQGTRQVAFAVVATTLVVCAVFLPVMFIAGNTGMLFRELAAAMIGAIAFSGFIALTLTPMLCSKMLKREAGHNRFTQWVDRKFETLAAWYRRTLPKVLHRPWLVGGGALVFVAVGLGLGATLPSELTPEEDMGRFNISAQAPVGTGFETMVRYMDGVEKILVKRLGDGEVRAAIVRAPGSFGASEDFSSGRATVFLKPWDERDRTTREIIEDLNKELRGLPGVRTNASVDSGLGRGGGRQPIQFVIAGDTFENLARARDRLLAAAEENPGIVDLDADYKETKPQVLIDIDTARAGDLGVSVTEIGTTLETMMGSRRATTYIDRGEEYYVVLQAEAGDRVTPGDLGNVYVRSATTGQLIPLSNVVRLRNYADAGELGRYNKLRAITVSGSLAPGYTLGEALDWLEVEAAKIPEITQVGYKGESLALKQTGSSIYIVFLLTIVVVYLVLAAQFESFIHPAVIVLTVPLAVGGGVLGLWAMGGTLNIYSQIGVVMLVGLAAKNGILIVEFANQLRDQGRAIEEAVIEAAERRLRPILMTSIATVAGAVPLMIASGAGAAARASIGTVVVWGVSLATILTLFVIPVFYNRLARRTSSPEAVARQLEAEMGGGAPQAAE